MVSIPETMLLRYQLLRRHNITATYCDDTMTISSQNDIPSSSFRCCHYDNDFSKKNQIFFTISLLRHHDIAATYCEDTVMISSQKDIPSSSFRCCHYDNDFSKKKNQIFYDIDYCVVMTSLQLIAITP